MTRWLTPPEGEEEERNQRNAKRRARRRLKRRLTQRNGHVPVKERLCLKCRELLAADNKDHCCPVCTKQNQRFSGKTYSVGAQ